MRTTLKKQLTSTTNKMQVRWFKRAKQKKRRRSTASPEERAYYQAHKERARELVVNRLEYYNQHYKLTWNRVAIRRQRRCWGSCSSLSNLNFNYRLLFLPPELQDYIVVHELCHLKELNHSSSFWQLVAQTVPDYEVKKNTLRRLEKEIFMQFK